MLFSKSKLEVNHLVKKIIRFWVDLRRFPEALWFDFVGVWGGIREDLERFSCASGRLTTVGGNKKFHIFGRGRALVRNGFQEDYMANGCNVLYLLATVIDHMHKPF